MIEQRQRWKRLVFAVPVGAVLFYFLFGSLFFWAEPHLGRAFPTWAWRHGTPQMQRYAAQVLITRIKPWMTYEQVLDIVGPGSWGWPSHKEHRLKHEETVGFNVRDDFNNGIDVGFQDGRVVSTFYYD